MGSHRWAAMRAARGAMGCYGVLWGCHGAMGVPWGHGGAMGVQWGTQRQMYIEELVRYAAGDALGL